MRHGVTLPCPRQQYVRRRCAPLAHRRAGFTLLEMLIVAAVLAVMATMSWPALRSQLDKSQLRGAAKQIRDRLARTRLRSIETGEVLRFRYVPGGAAYQVSAAGAHQDDRRGALPPPSDARAFDDFDENERLRDDESDRTDRSWVEESQLPQGLSFARPSINPRLVETARDETPGGFEESQDVDPDLADPDRPVDNRNDSRWSEAIVFYPNGRTTDARIRVIGSRRFHADVSLRGLTGAATVSDLGRSEDQP